MKNFIINELEDIKKHLTLASYATVKIAKKGFNSEWGNFFAEGIVAKPEVELFARNGQRIITKIKYKDWIREEK